jgi:hypothetical protein
MYSTNGLCADPEEKWTPNAVDKALWCHYLARELKPELIEAMPAADGSLRNVIKSTENNEDSVHTTDITPTIPTATLTVSNGNAANSLSDENSSGPSSEVEDKSNDSSFVANKNGNGNIGNLNGEDSKDFGSECVESEDSRLIASEENSIDNGLDSSVEPVFKKQRVDGSDQLSAVAVAVGEDAQL